MPSLLDITVILLIACICSSVFCIMFMSVYSMPQMFRYKKGPDDFLILARIIVTFTLFLCLLIYFAIFAHFGRIMHVVLTFHNWGWESSNMKPTKQKAIAVSIAAAGMLYIVSMYVVIILTITKLVQKTRKSLVDGLVYRIIQVHFAIFAMICGYFVWDFKQSAKIKITELSESTSPPYTPRYTPQWYSTFFDEYESSGEEESSEEEIFYDIQLDLTGISSWTNKTEMSMNCSEDHDIGQLKRMLQMKVFHPNSGIVLTNDTEEEEILQQLDEKYPGDHEKISILVEGHQQANNTRIGDIMQMMGPNTMFEVMHE